MPEDAFNTKYGTKTPTKALKETLLTTACSSKTPELPHHSKYSLIFNQTLIPVNSLAEKRMRYSEHKTQIADSIDSLSKTNYEIKRGIKAIRGDIKLRNKSMNDNPRYILSTPDTNRKKKKINPLVKKTLIL